MVRFIFYTVVSECTYAYIMVHSSSYICVEISTLLLATSVVSSRIAFLSQECDRMIYGLAQFCLLQIILPVFYQQHSPRYSNKYNQPIQLFIALRVSTVVICFQIFCGINETTKILKHETIILSQNK